MSGWVLHVWARRWGAPATSQALHLAGVSLSPHFHRALLRPFRRTRQLRQSTHQLWPLLLALDAPCWSPLRCPAFSCLRAPVACLDVLSQPPSCELPKLPNLCFSMPVTHSRLLALKALVAQLRRCPGNLVSGHFSWGFPLILQVPTAERQPPGHRLLLTKRRGKAMKAFHPCSFDHLLVCLGQAWPTSVSSCTRQSLPQVASRVTLFQEDCTCDGSRSIPRWGDVLDLLLGHIRP